MIPLEAQIVCALLLDQVLGDPRWLPHPVRLMGNLALICEGPLRALIPNPRAAGVAAVGVVLSATILSVAGLLGLAARIHPLLGDAAAILLLYTSFAARDLVRHSRAVYEALARGDLAEARRRVGWIVGRETAELTPEEIARASVESVAENLVDGVTAPLFWAVLFGPVGALGYKAVNTLDSTFGYKNERYARFGWASARLDDLAGLLPSRLTALMVPVAAGLLGERAGGAWRIFRRDRARHESPNAGQTEAAVAGALGVRLGGPAVYFGRRIEKPALGDAAEPLEAGHILRANRLMLLTSGLSAASWLGLRWLLTGLGAH